MTIVEERVPSCVKQRLPTNEFRHLHNEYRRHRLKRIALEEQFNIVDSLEMVSANTLEKWWNVLQALKKRELALELRISSMEHEWSVLASQVR